MEEVSCSNEVDKIEEQFHKAFNMDSGVLYFPVRHHSPACSMHLEKTIREYKPEAILIEGPSDANHIIPVLVHPETKPPLAIYYSFDDKKGFVNQDRKGEKYRCYFPFLEYSPELRALKTAAQMDIKACFIDLPYPEILINTREERKNYNDDYLLSRSRFISRLCEKEGCRNFNELWEKLFEIDGVHSTTGDFVKSLLAYCLLSREDYTEEMLAAEGCTAREKYMAACIREHVRFYKKVLVVTGGFHTAGLTALAGVNEKVKFHDTETGSTAAYPMAYSFKETDMLNGYASGMPFPAFYQRVWTHLSRDSGSAYEKAVLDFVVRCGNRSRMQDSGISTADQIEALNMARGLKQLRKKYEYGVYELIDAVETAFIKGEKNTSNRLPVEILNNLLTGEKTGALCNTADIPPLVKDFYNRASALGIKNHSTTNQEAVLDIYRKKKHKDLSEFFYTMEFLGTGFSKMVRGPDFINRKDTNLIRETWQYSWNHSVDSTLIDLSVYGGTLKEAAGELVAVKLADAKDNSGTASLLMLKGFLMGTGETVRQIEERMAVIIQQDGLFRSLADCTYNLNFLYNACLKAGKKNTAPLQDLLQFAYQRAAFLIPGLEAIPPDRADNAIKKLKDLSHIVMQNRGRLDREPLISNLSALLKHGPDITGSIEGAVVGLLYGMNRQEISQVTARAMGYLLGTGRKQEQAAGFLKGLFATARDVILLDKTLIEGVNRFLAEVPEEQFLRLIPEFRVAFSFFTPGEIDSLSSNVSGLFNLKKEDLDSREAIGEGELEYAKELDAYAAGKLREWRMYKNL